MGKDFLLFRTKINDERARSLLKDDGFANLITVRRKVAVRCLLV